VADSKKRINLIRNGKMVELHFEAVMVGDLVLIREGMEVPADGMVV
jgi:P-type E1-E2 ATPase